MEGWVGTFDTGQPSSLVEGLHSIAPESDTAVSLKQSVISASSSLTISAKRYIKLINMYLKFSY